MGCLASTAPCPATAALLPPRDLSRDQHLGFFLEDEPSFHSFHGKRQMGSVAQPCK